MSETNNPLLCDPATGACELPAQSAASSSLSKIKEEEERPVIDYFTDPICSSCWGIEPQLRKLKLEYGDQVIIRYHMGGLLPDWSYNSGGISKPLDVAHHWDEVSLYYQMPIDGDVWLEDPLDSSYPPSIAFKAAQLQEEKKAILFLREMREMLFLKKINIAKWENMEPAAKRAGLDVAQLKEDFEGKARLLFEQDLHYSRQSGVRGFPTFIIKNEENKREVIYGFRSYEQMESTLLSVKPDLIKHTYVKDWKSLFTAYPTLTLREFSELAETGMQQAEQELERLTAEKKLDKFTCKNGSIWSMHSPDQE